MIDAVNRVVLALIGLALAAAGAVTLLAANDVIDIDQPGQLYGRAADNTGANPWVWGVAAIAGAVVVAVLGLYWVVRQVRARSDGPGIGTTDYIRTPKGTTTLEPAAVAKAVARDLERVPGVAGSRVRITELRPRPHVIAVLSLHDDAEVSAVTEGIEEPLGRLRENLGASDLSADVRLRPTAGRGSRVV